MFVKTQAGVDSYNMFNPFLTMIPLSGCLALLINYWISLQLTRELTEKLGDIEAVTINAVNTSRECGKDVANKTVIAIGLNISMEFMMKELKEINNVNKTTISHAYVDTRMNENINNHDKQESFIKATKDKIESNDEIMNEDKMLKKTEVRQNRLQMYGVKMVTMEISLVIIFL